MLLVALPLNVLTTISFRRKLPILPSLLLVWRSLPKVSLELIAATNHILLLIMTRNYILWIFSRNGGSVRTTPWCSRDFYCPYVFQVHHLSLYQRHSPFWCFLFSLLRFVDSFDPLCKFLKFFWEYDITHGLRISEKWKLFIAQGTTSMTLKFNYPFCGRLGKRFEGLVLHEVRVKS